MIPILYESSETAFISNGIGRLPDCSNFDVVEERHGVYTATFDYPVDGMNYGELMLGRTIAVTHDDSGEIEPFDLVAVSRPINGVVTFTAEHVSYRLNKKVIKDRYSGNLAGIMGFLTGQEYGFQFETDIPSSGNAVEVTSSYPVPVRKYLGGMEGSLLDTFGGEYEFKGFKVILHKARGEKKDFAIRYGLNMADYNEDIDYSETYTKVMPYWIGSSGNNSEAIVVGDIVDSGQPYYSGLDNCVPLDLSDKFDTKPTKAQLNSAALSYMASNQPYLAQHNIKIDFIRLQDSPEYAQFKSLLSCKLCDSIEVIFPRYGTRGFFKIVKVSWDPLKERYNYMELGDLQTSLADALGVGSESSNPRTELIKVRHQVLYSSADDGAHVSIAPGATSEQTFPVTKDGYMALGLVGHAFAGSYRGQMSLGCKGRVNTTAVGSCTVDVLMRNNGTSGTWAGGLYVDILWMKI